MAVQSFLTVISLQKRACPSAILMPERNGGIAMNAFNRKEIVTDQPGKNPAGRLVVINLKLSLFAQA